MSNPRFPFFYHIGDELIDGWLDKANERIKQVIKQRNQEEIKFLKKLEVFSIPIHCETCRIVCPLIGKRYQKLRKQLTNSENQNE